MRAARSKVDLAGSHTEMLHFFGARPHLELSEDRTQNTEAQVVTLYLYWISYELVSLSASQVSQSVSRRQSRSQDKLKTSDLGHFAG